MRKSTRRRGMAKVERWAHDAVAAAGEVWPITSRPAVSLASALLQARAQQYAADTIGRALNRVADALEALAQARKP